MLGFCVLLEDQDANVIIALALHSALLQLVFLKVMTYAILLIRDAFSCAGSLAGALKLNAPQPRPLASGEDAAANRRCWSRYNSCQWVSDMVRFRGHVAGCIIVDVSVVRLLCVLFS